MHFGLCSVSHLHLCSHVQVQSHARLTSCSLKEKSQDRKLLGRKNLVNFSRINERYEDIYFSCIKTHYNSFIPCWTAVTTFPWRLWLRLWLADLNNNFELDWLILITIVWVRNKKIQIPTKTNLNKIKRLPEILVYNVKEIRNTSATFYSFEIILLKGIARLLILIPLHWPWVVSESRAKLEDQFACESLGGKHQRLDPFYPSIYTHRLRHRLLPQWRWPVRTQQQKNER